MALNKGKHIVEEIDGVRCTVGETGITQERIDFLKKLLELNGYEVKTGLDKDGVSLKIGVTDILFNPVIAIYERKLRTPENKILTPQYWKGMTEESGKWYWKVNN